MYKKSCFIKLIFILISPLFLLGCATTSSPKGFLELSPDSLKHREMQSRQFDTKDEQQIIFACSSLLQDIGFTLTEIEVKLGLIVGSKERDATVPGQIFLAALADALAGAGGSSGGALQQTDATQSILVSCITRLSLDRSKVNVRTTFQRVIFNQMGQVNRMENIDDSKVYEGFFEKLSKSVFLEANKI